MQRSLMVAGRVVLHALLLGPWIAVLVAVVTVDTWIDSLADGLEIPVILSVAWLAWAIGASGVALEMRQYPRWAIAVPWGCLAVLLVLLLLMAMAIGAALGDAHYRWD